MRLSLDVDVPTSADGYEMMLRLRAAAAKREGLTLVLPSGYMVDVDLCVVHLGEEALSHERV